MSAGLEFADRVILAGDTRDRTAVEFHGPAALCHSPGRPPKCKTIGCSSRYGILLRSELALGPAASRDVIVIPLDENALRNTLQDPVGHVDNVAPDK